MAVITRGRVRRAVVVAGVVPLLSAGLLLVGQTTSPTPSAAEQVPFRPGMPNIVVINTDDQRPDSVAAMPKVKYWLARAGRTFTRGYASIPSCCPSRATLFSGRYAHNNRQTTQRGHGLDMDLTLQRWLHDAGYFTGHSGKYIHWWPLDQVAPHWDRWTSFHGGGYNDLRMNLDGVVLPTKGYSTDIVFDRAIGYLEDFEKQQDPRPFFLHITPKAPHLPATPAPEYADAVVPAFDRDPAYLERDRSDKPRIIREHRLTHAEVWPIRRDMYRTLYSVDDGVDRLMRALHATGELADTMVIYTSDNGFSLGEHGWLSKFVPYRGSVQVPFIVRWPGHVAPGTRDTRFVTHADIAPTVLAAAGLTQNQVRFDGRNFLGSNTRRGAFLEYFNDPANNRRLQSWASLRTRRYQYTEWYSLTRPRRVTFREYYDMRRDPYQLRNLLYDGRRGNDPDVTRLHRILAEQRRCSGSACW